MGKIFSAYWQPYSVSLAHGTYTLLSGIRLGLLVSFFLTQTLLASNDTIAPEQASGSHVEQVKIAYGESIMVVTANPYASQAAFTILEQGGSAIDAAIAAQLVLGLVEPQSSGIGGGGFLLHWDNTNKKLLNYNGRETAPQDINSNHFMQSNEQTMSFYDAVIGGYSVGTPGLIAMLEAAHQAHGKLNWKALFQPAIQLSQQGFNVSKRLHQLIRYINQGEHALHNDKSNEPLANYLLSASQKALPVGAPLKNLEYAKTLQQIAEQGSKAFYSGDIAQAMVNAVQNHKRRAGSLQLSDLAHYKTIISEPLCKQIQAFNVCGSPPPSSGPITVIQQLGLLTQTPQLQGLAYNSTSFYHRFIEANKLSLADRNQYIEDPNFNKLPYSALIEDHYLAQRAQQLPLLKASTHTAKAGIPNAKFSQYQPAGSPELPSTTHLSIVDADGNIVSMTSSIETAFGSRILVNGFILNNQLTDFSFNPEQDGIKVANRIEPGKQPRSSMAPMIVFNNSQPRLVVGSPGGSRIIPYVSKVIAQNLLLNASLEEAINSPHVTNLNQPQSTLEASTPLTNKLSKQLQQLGHTLTIKPQTSGIHAISISAAKLEGVADTRREGAAIGK